MKEKTADIDILEEELRKDILYQIDMQLYDEFNDKFCEINENLGIIYTYKDLEDIKQAESETERRLLRQAIETLVAENKEVKEEIEELKENNGYHLGFIDGGIAKRYEYEDKIKAKIEDILNSENGEVIEKLIEWQSLLGKE